MFKLKEMGFQGKLIFLNDKLFIRCEFMWVKGSCGINKS